MNKYAFRAGVEFYAPSDEKVQEFREMIRSEIERCLKKIEACPINHLDGNEKGKFAPGLEVRRTDTPESSLVS